MTNHCFVAIGDTHLQRSHPRNADRLRALDQIIGENEAREDLAAWLWPGDLFHTRSTPQDRLDIADRVLRMATRAPVVVCRGNHDQEGDVDIFGLLKAAHPVYVVAAGPTTLSLRTATWAFASIFVLPHLNLGRLVADGTPSAHLFQAARVALEGMFYEAAGTLLDRRADGHLTLMIGHMAIGGCLLSNGQPTIGREPELDAGLLGTLGDVPKLMAHIHEPQDIHGATFIGSITAQDFGEITPRRYVRLHMGDEGGWSLESCPLDTPRLYHVEGRLTRQGFTGQVTAGPGGARQDPPPSWDDCEVRVRYRYPQSEASVLDHEVVRAGFVGARRLHLEPIAEQDRDLRAPQIAAARTLAEKVTAYQETKGESISQGMLDKLARLEHDDHEAIVGDVQAFVARVEATPITSAADDASALQEALL